VNIEQLLTSPLFVLAVACATAGAVLVLAGLAALWRARLLRFAGRTVLGLLFVALGALASTIAMGIQGYRALTREETAAQIVVTPLGAQRFRATFRYPDGRQATYELAGDEIYVDAHILKWKPVVNFLGLHTAYELDRVAGRYNAINEERNGPRTVHSLGRERAVDLYGLRRRHEFLAPLLDAEYGSATFIPVTHPTEFELRVSTTGLLIREITPPS
jgi:hypothetical protein